MSGASSGVVCYNRLDSNSFKLHGCGWKVAFGNGIEAVFLFELQSQELLKESAYFGVVLAAL